MISKDEMQKILKRTIRQDTYQITRLIIEKGFTYEEARREIETYPAHYNIFKKFDIVKESTINEVIRACQLKKEVDRKIDEEKSDYDYIKTLYGIYGIYIDDELKYIGKTSRSFQKRFEDYALHIKKNQPQQKIEYMIIAAKNRGRKVQFRPLITNEEFPYGKVTDKELQKIEYSLIKILKPAYNVEGVSQTYTFQ